MIAVAGFLQASERGKEAGQARGGVCLRCNCRQSYVVVVSLSVQQVNESGSTLFVGVCNSSASPRDTPRALAFPSEPRPRGRPPSLLRHPRRPES